MPNSEGVDFPNPDRAGRRSMSGLLLCLAIAERKSAEAHGAGGLIVGVVAQTAGMQHSDPSGRVCSSPPLQQPLLPSV